MLQQEQRTQESSTNQRTIVIHIQKTYLLVFGFEIHFSYNQPHFHLNSSEQSILLNRSKTGHHSIHHLIKWSGSTNLHKRRLPLPFCFLGFFLINSKYFVIMILLSSVNYYLAILLLNALIVLESLDFFKSRLIT